MNELTWILIQARIYAQDYLEDQQEFLEDDYLDEEVADGVKANIQIAEEFIEKVTEYAQQHRSLIDVMP